MAKNAKSTEANGQSENQIERFADLYIDRALFPNGADKENQARLRYLVVNRHRYGANEGGISGYSYNPYNYLGAFRSSAPYPYPCDRDKLIGGLSSKKDEFLGRVVFVDSTPFPDDIKDYTRSRQLIEPVNAAIAVGALKPPKPKEVLFVVDYADLPELGEDFEQILRDNFEVYADVRDPKFAFCGIAYDAAKGGWQYSYKGERPANIFVGELREEIIMSAIGVLSRCESDIQNPGIDTSVKVLTAFGLGKFSFSKDATKAKSCAAWKRSIIKRVDYADGDAPVLATLKEDVAAAKAIEEIWVKELKDAHILVYMGKFSKMKESEAEDIARSVAGLLCVEDMLDTYLEGVPLEDILA